MKVWLFGGTTEGRLLAEWLTAQGIEHQVAVATDYGKSLLPDSPVEVGRLGQEEMERGLTQGFTHVVDATHPYATQVTAFLRQACQQQNVPYLRLLRPLGTEGNWHSVANTQEAVAKLHEMDGNILLTTGAKELPAYASLATRCFPRVLPMISSLESCAKAGIPPKQIICMQGPFTLETNCALLRQYQIKILVSKFTGTEGGFAEKIQAAEQCGCQSLVISVPTQETGLDLEAMKAKLQGE